MAAGRLLVRQDHRHDRRDIIAAIITIHMLR
jgi:hypothetical protein